jgi:hypothetical protein
MAMHTPVVPSVRSYGGRLDYRLAHAPPPAAHTDAGMEGVGAAALLMRFTGALATDAPATNTLAEGAGDRLTRRLCARSNRTLTKSTDARRRVAAPGDESDGRTRGEGWPVGADVRRERGRAARRRLSPGDGGGSATLQRRDGKKRLH